jgi:hypothetical protein
VLLERDGHAHTGMACRQASRSIFSTVEQLRTTIPSPAASLTVHLCMQARAGAVFEIRYVVYGIVAQSITCNLVFNDDDTSDDATPVASRGVG